MNAAFNVNLLSIAWILYGFMKSNALVELGTPSISEHRCLRCSLLLLHCQQYTLALLVRKFSFLKVVFFFLFLFTCFLPVHCLRALQYYASHLEPSYQFVSIIIFTRWGRSERKKLNVVCQLIFFYSNFEKGFHNKRTSEV